MCLNEFLVTIAFFFARFAAIQEYNIVIFVISHQEVDWDAHLNCLNIGKSSCS